MPLVEVVPHAGTSEEAMKVAVEFYKSLGKHPVHIKLEIPGFAANRIQAAVCSEAYSLVQRGVLSAADVGMYTAISRVFLNVIAEQNRRCLYHDQSWAQMGADRAIHEQCAWRWRRS